VRIYASLAQQLKEEADPLASETWTRLQGQMSTEQLAFIAALSVGVSARLKKRVLYSR
jgi:hypothetical protein